MMPDAEGRPAQAEACNCFLRILVLCLHEPAWLVGTDRHDGKPDVAVLFAQFAIMLAVGIARVADMVDLAA